jgi:cell division protein FtsB
VGSYAKKKIIEAYPELNMDWVITGNGSMLKGAELKKYNKNIVEENHITQVKEDADVYGKMNEEVVALKRELELYKMLYEKEHKDVKDLSEQVGALKAEIDNLKKGENCSETESVSVKKKRKAS